jgi:hypothetical protein
VSENQVRGALELFDAIKQMIGDDYETVVVGEPEFRPGTKLAVVKYNFVFAGAGIGDFICYMPAMLWLAKHCPWIKGRIWVPQFFCEFAENCMREHLPRWKVGATELINEMVEPRTVFRGPAVSIGGRSAGHQLLNGTGSHLVDLGFSYFVNQTPPPEGGDFYPTLDFSHMPGNPLFVHNQKPIDNYAVFTTGGVTPVRTVPGEFWNPIIDYVKKLGLTPVFLGKKSIPGGVEVSFPDGCNYDQGVDMRDKTTLMEAAYIMKHAKVVLGFDNGLIHLASCTDANIVAAYNIVHPKERRPRRWKGLWREIFLTKKELACSSCQTFMKSLPLHTFKNCLYDEVIPTCTKMIFEDDAVRWKSEINTILVESGYLPF